MTSDIDPRARKKWLVMTLSLCMLTTVMPAVSADSPDDSGRVRVSAIPERIVWDRTPISLELPVGRERIVQFDDAVKIAAPSELQGSLRTQIIEGTVYWLARQPFGPHRILVREIDDGTTYLIDLSAVDTTAEMPKVRIVDGVATRSAKSSASRSEATRKPETARRPDPVSLTRFAAQQLYAPRRLAPTDPDIHRVPLRSRREIALFRGGLLSSTPAASWRGGDLYVTAVTVRNRGDDTLQTVELDPRDIRGHWISATFQHGWLGPANTRNDTTVVYLVSDRPFEEAAK